MLIIELVFYNKLCWNTCVTNLKFKIYKIITYAIGCLAAMLRKNNDIKLNNSIKKEVAEVENFMIELEWKHATAVIMINITSTTIIH